jgi:hypothetical protein
MTAQIPKMQRFETAPPQEVVPQLDEGVWQAWVQKGKRQETKFARRVTVIVILAVLFGVVAWLAVVTSLRGKHG